MYTLFSRHHRNPTTTTTTEEDEPMRILFRDPTNPKDLCVAKIDSAETDLASNLLRLYGSFRGCPALFRIPTASIRMADALYSICRLNLISDYAAKITDDNTNLIVVDFYKN